MRVGCPKEIKNHEYRVGLTPAAAREYVAHGHQVMIETGAGAGIDAADADYEAAGAAIVSDRSRDLRRRRHGGEGEGAAAGRVGAAA